MILIDDGLNDGCHSDVLCHGHIPSYYADVSLFIDQQET
jgi:hypothetical protein